MPNNVLFEEVNGSKEHRNLLYKHLSGRKYNISHKTLPSFGAHRNFVLNHPYRKWFLIRIEGIDRGNLYVQDDNTVGLNGLDQMDLEELDAVIRLLDDVISPLPAIPSKRSKGFTINVSPDDAELQKNLNLLGWKLIQLGFSRG